MRHFGWLCLVLACSEEETGTDLEALKAEAEAALADHKSISGTVGYELLGHGNQFYSDHFDESCIEAEECMELSGREMDRCWEEKGLGWVERERVMFQGKRTAHFAPNYKAQEYITSRTEDGYCLYMGKDLEISLDEVVEASNEGRELEANPITYSWSVSISDESPYFKCLKKDVLQTSLTVMPGETFVEPEILRLFDNNCQQADGGMPEPYSREDRGGQEIEWPDEPPEAPSKREVLDLIKDMEEALAERDIEAALALTQCYNLFVVSRSQKAAQNYEKLLEWKENVNYGEDVQEMAVGACIPSDFLDTGAAFTGDLDDFLVPWLERHEDWAERPIDSPPEIGEPRLEKREASGSFYHVELLDTALEKGDPPACGKRSGNRSLTVQWVDDEWKLVGLIADDANGINPVRFVNDLHGRIVRPMEQCTSPKYWEWNVPQWAVFWDRLHGAPLDSWGCVNRRKCDRSFLSYYTRWSGMND